MEAEILNLMFLSPLAKKKKLQHLSLSKKLERKNKGLSKMGWYFLAICILYPKELAMAQAERLFYTGQLGRVVTKNKAKRIDYNAEAPNWAKQRRRGLSVKEIAQAAGVSESVIYNKTKDLALAKDQHGTFYPYKIKEA